MGALYLQGDNENGHSGRDLDGRQIDFRPQLTTTQ